MAKKQEQKLVLNQLIIKPPTRRTFDVGEWRNAMKSADMGRLKQLYDLFEDLLIDGVLSDAVDKRIMAVTNSPLTFQNANGEEVPEILELIDTPAFEDLLSTICSRIFWGRAGGEFNFTDGFGFTPIPAKHIKIENRSILINDQDEAGIPYDGDDHLLVIGKPRNFGLLLKTAPYAIWKRGGFGDYAQWLEIFGMPQRVGKYSSYDPESRKLLEQALEQAGSAPYVIVPKESEVETTNNTGSGSSGASYNEFRRACNEEILITILGQTLTTVQNETGARSLGEVHKEVEEGKNRSDMRYVQRVLNRQVLPILEKRGFPVAGGRFVFPEAAEQLSVADIVQLSDILEIPASFLHDKYSIPVPKDGETIARRGGFGPAQPPDGSGRGVGDEGGDDDTPDDDDIKNSDKSLFLRLWDFFVHAPALTGASNGKALTSGKLPGGDTFNNRIISFATTNQKFMPELFVWISSDLIRALDARPVRNADIGFEYGYQNDAFRTAQELNIFRFSSGKDIAEIQMLNELYRKSKSPGEFYKLASGKIKVWNEDYQKTEWQTATLISESAENYNRLRGKTEIFPNWQYKTVEDDKVRDSHYKLNNLILPASDERWDKIFPPNGWKCRCRVVPKMRHEFDKAQLETNRQIADEYINSPEFLKAVESGFGVNRGKLPLVFTENQNYIQKFDSTANKILKEITWKDYGLKTAEELMAESQSKIQLFEGTIDDYLATGRTENGKTLFSDYNNRSIVFDIDDYRKTHTPDKEAKRAKLIKAASEALLEPHEVWINNSGRKDKTFTQFVFIKYFSDTAIVAIASIERGTAYKLNTWFRLHKNARNYRWGLLIKKPSN